MAIKISINAAYPAFASLPIEQLKKVAVVIGPQGMSSHFFSYDTPATVNFGTLGDAGMSHTAPAVSYTKPLTFSREAFGVFGNITTTDFNACRLATILADYVKKGALVVEDAGVPLTASQVLLFVP